MPCRRHPRSRLRVASITVQTPSARVSSKRALAAAAPLPLALNGSIWLGSGRIPRMSGTGCESTVASAPIRCSRGRSMSSRKSLKPIAYSFRSTGRIMRRLVSRRISRDRRFRAAPAAYHLSCPTRFSSSKTDRLRFSTRISAFGGECCQMEKRFFHHATGLSRASFGNAPSIPLISRRAKTLTADLRASIAVGEEPEATKFHGDRTFGKEIDGRFVEHPGDDALMPRAI